jgi:NAD(P)-dependent dehydrogenase (short-subunit alcohol dehydrogenase family)
MNLLDLSSKTIFITGGAGEIGRVVVQALAEHGATVAVNDIVDPAEAKWVLPKHERIGYFRGDLTQPPNVVCCHAGRVMATPVQDYPLDDYDQLMNLNTRSAFIVAQEAVRRWLKAGVQGHLIFTTSWVADVPWPEITPYAMSKSAMTAMMRGFAREMAPQGIRANAIAPGIVSVGLAKRQWDTDAAYKTRASKAIPLGVMQPPESVANAFVFLCSDMAAYMTGSTLLVDGGCSLYPMD